MSKFADAMQAYKEKKYMKALQLFEEIKTIYGVKVVEVNIQLCRKKIKECTNNEKQIQVIESEKVEFNYKSDYATLYMLAKMGKIDLTQEQIQECFLQYKRLSSQKSQYVQDYLNKLDSVDPSRNYCIDSNFPKSTNDFIWYIKPELTPVKSINKSLEGLSIIVPTFNRGNILDITLTCLVNQETQYPFEVVVADDGSQEPIESIVRRYENLIDIKYVRQKDCGYRLSAIRNLGLRVAKYDFVAILDCDMAPNFEWVESYMSVLTQNDNVVWIGPRKYVDTNNYVVANFSENKKLIEKLPEIKTNNSVASKDFLHISVDWRLEHFRETEDLRLCNVPFRFFSGGNVAFPRKWLDCVGGFDEDFFYWGGEDNEFGYRLYRQGCFFRVAWGAMAYHQEPSSKENETNRTEGKKITSKLVYEKVPYFYRKIEPLEAAFLHQRPLVSIYIVVHNCANYIVDHVSSLLNQTVVDLEVCIFDNGSTDNTYDVLSEFYEKNPRVKFSTQSHTSIYHAISTVVGMTSGYYIGGQVNLVDCLNSNLVEFCLKNFLIDHKLACIHISKSDLKYSDTDQNKISPEMCTNNDFHFFTARSWSLMKARKKSIAINSNFHMCQQFNQVGEIKYFKEIKSNQSSFTLQSSR